MIQVIRRLEDELGVPGSIALALLGASALFYFTTVRPLEQRIARLDQALAQAPGNGAPARPQARPSKLGAYYGFFESDEGKAVWLAKIHSVAAVSGIELRTGDYRVAESPGRIERYQVTLPLAGTYTQIWTFLEGVLTEVPTLSLDQITLRRKSVGEPRAEADVSLTLHSLKR